MRCDELMKTDVECCQAADPITDVAIQMRDRNIGFLPVCSPDKRVIGTVTDRDLAIRIIAEKRDPKSTRVDAVMSRDVVSCHAVDDLKVAEDLMAQHHKSRIVCTGKSGELLGVISLSDIAGAEDDDRTSELLRSVVERELGAP